MKTQIKYSKREQDLLNTFADVSGELSKEASETLICIYRIGKIDQQNESLQFN